VTVGEVVPLHVIVTLGLGPPSGVSIGRLSGVGALWVCVSRVCGGGGGCGLTPQDSGFTRCGEVSLGGIQSSIVYT